MMYQEAAVDGVGAPRGWFASAGVAAQLRGPIMVADLEIGGGAPDVTLTRLRLGPVEFGG